MSEYRLEKIEKDVVLFLQDGVFLQGVVFLSPYAYGHSGNQTLLELLLEMERFLPFRDLAGQVRLVNREAVSHVRHEPGGEEDSLLLGERAAVRLIFFGGETLEGAVTLEMPEEKNRLKDYLNLAPACFTLISGTSHYIVNARHVQQVIPLA